MNTWTKAALIALRIAVGWHFLYEGLWKMDSDTGATSYATAWYTLHSSLARLQQSPTLAGADAWYEEVVKSFKARNKALAEDQKARLAGLRDKVKLAIVAGEADPVDFEWTYVREEVLRIAAEKEGERFTALPYLQASAGPFQPAFRALVNDIDGLERLTVAWAQTAIDARYGEILQHYRFTADQQARFAATRDDLKASIAATLGAPSFQVRLADYRTMRRRVANATARITPFVGERIDADRGKLDGIAAELLGYVNEPLAELAVQAQLLATAEQLGAGPLPRPGDASGWIDRSIRWGLTAIGACLLLGVLTPYAAIAAALQLLMFYLASPPWPGLPAATLGGHYLYVDRNLIELVAALVIATTSTGTLAGLDAYLFRRRATASVPESATLTSVS